MRITPVRETMPPTFSTTVNGSLSEGITEQVKDMTVGTRKVMTVASGSGRYVNESVNSQQSVFSHGACSRL